LANTWGPHLGTPGAEIPKYDNFSTPYLFGMSQVGISGLASTRETYPWVFRVPKRRNAEPSHTMPIRDPASRGFVYRNLAIQEVEDSHSSTTRMPKSRYTRSSYTRPNSGFRESEFHDVRKWEASHLDLPGAETPKYQLLTRASISGFHPSKFRGSGIRDLRVQGTRF
jgi:hypothetical protein